MPVSQNKNIVFYYLSLCFLSACTMESRRQQRVHCMQNALLLYCSIQCFYWALHWPFEVKHLDLSSYNGTCYAQRHRLNNIRPARTAMHKHCVKRWLTCQFSERLLASFSRVLNRLHAFIGYSSSNVCLHAMVKFVRQRGLYQVDAVTSPTHDVTRLCSSEMIFQI